VNLYPIDLVKESSKPIIYGRAALLNIAKIKVLETL